MTSKIKAVEQYSPVMQFVFNFSISLKWICSSVYFAHPGLGVNWLSTIFPESQEQLKLGEKTSSYKTFTVQKHLSSVLMAG